MKKSFRFQPYSHLYEAKWVRALRGYFGPLMSLNNKSCSSQVSSYWFIRTIAKV